MWFSKKKENFEELESEKKELERKNESLREERMGLKEEVENLKLKKKISDEDIKHMVKMKTEAMELDFKKREVEEDGKRATKIAAVKDKFQDKMEAQLTKETDNIKEMYSQILQRLPNVNAKLTGSLDGK